MSLAKEAAEMDMRNLGDPGSPRFQRIQRRLGDLHRAAVTHTKDMTPTTREVISARLDQMEALNRQKGTLGLKSGYLLGGMFSGGLSWLGGPPKTEPDELQKAYSSAGSGAKSLLEGHVDYRKRFAAAHIEHGEKVEALLKRRKDPKFMTRVAAKLTRSPKPPELHDPSYVRPPLRKAEFILR